MYSRRVFGEKKYWDFGGEGVLGQMMVGSRTQAFSNPRLQGRQILARVLLFYMCEPI